MGKITRLLFGLLAFLMGASSYSQTCTLYRVDIFSPPDTQKYTSKAAACSAECSQGGLPVSSATSDSNCQCNGPGSNPTGGYATFLNQPCPNPDACGSQTGTVLKQNITNGYARSGVADALDHVGKLFSPYDNGIPTFCVNKCAVKATNQTAAYRSAEPSPNGLHRLSVDYEFTVQGTAGQAGTTCTAATNPQAFTDALSPNTPPMACAGVVGTVNGKKVCAPDGSTNTIPAPQGEPLPGNELTGNPRAGDVPTTGEGSGTGGAGRTPTAGNGTASGGPIGAAGTGIAPTGAVSSPAAGMEQAACGAPGQPPCKIDESGTPSTGNLSEGENALNQAKTDAIAEINKTRTGQGFTWTFSLPTGCQPLSIPAFAGFMDSIDICQFQPMIHDLLSMIWIAATIFALWGMASRAFAPE